MSQTYLELVEELDEAYDKIISLQAVVDAADLVDQYLTAEGVRLLTREAREAIKMMRSALRALDGEPVLSKSVRRRLEIQRGVPNSETLCPKCEGYGTIEYHDMICEGPPMTYLKRCEACGGTGRKE